MKFYKDKTIRDKYPTSNMPSIHHSRIFEKRDNMMMMIMIMMVIMMMKLVCSLLFLYPKVGD